MEITYQERIGLDGEPVLVPVIAHDATADEMAAIVAAEGAAVMTDEQAAQAKRPSWRGGHRRRRRAVTPACLSARTCYRAPRPPAGPETHR